MFQLTCDRCQAESTFTEAQVKDVHSIRLDNVHYNVCVDCYETILDAMAMGSDATDSVR